MLRMGDRIGKIIKLHRRVNGAAIGIFPHQKAEKGGFAPAVAADEPQLPPGVDLKAGMGEDLVIAGRIGKGQIGYLDERHKKPPWLRLKQ